MARLLSPRVQQVIDDVTATLAHSPDREAELGRRLGYLLALLHAAADSAEEVDLLMASPSRRPAGRPEAAHGDHWTR